jgi:hypothetical protein
LLTEDVLSICVRPRPGFPGGACAVKPKACGYGLGLLAPNVELLGEIGRKPGNNSTFVTTA